MKPFCLQHNLATVERLNLSFAIFVLAEKQPVTTYTELRIFIFVPYFFLLPSMCFHLLLFHLLSFNFALCFFTISFPCQTTFGLGEKLLVLEATDISIGSILVN
jgi:hypothetical protein